MPYTGSMLSKGLSPSFQRVLSLLFMESLLNGLHVMSLDCLLKLSKAMRSIVVKSSEALEIAAAATLTAVKKACQIIAIIKEDKFWEDLKESVIPDCDIFFVIHKILLINTVLQAIFNL